MRRLITLVLFVAAGCSPAQEAAWWNWWHRDPKAAAEWATEDCGALCVDDWDRDGIVEPEPSATPDFDEPDHPGEEDHWAASGQCSEWYGTAIAAGWSDSDWPTVDRIMWAESGCNPNAYNSTTHFGGNASGLMQIIDPTWQDECGYSDIFDPWQNLSCALYLKNTYGWSQWSTY